MSIPKSPAPLRRFAAALLPAALLTGLLAGCADASAPAPSGSSTTASAAGSDLATITVTPAADSKSPPTIALPSKPFRIQDSRHRILTEGTGAAITEPARVSANWARYSGVTGAVMDSSYGATPATLLIEKDSAAVPGFVEALKGQKVGALALVAVPAAKILSESQLSQGMTLDDTVLYVLQVTATQPLVEKVTGTQAASKPGLPTVVVPDDPTQPAKITVPDPTPIKESTVQTLITGTGPKVTKGQTVRVRYTGTTWRTPQEPFDYSGKSAKTTVDFPIGAGRLIKAWDNTIPGQTVGSRLLLVVQPVDGYGPNGNPDAQIKGDDVLIFVMDILGAWDE